MRTRRATDAGRRGPSAGWWRLVVAVAAVAVAAAACAPPGPSGAGGSAAGAAARELVASLRAEPRTLNPLLVRDSASNVVARLLHASLVRVDRVDDRIEPWLAARWAAGEPSGEDGGVAYTLELRDDVRFSDGTPFTAADVLFSFQAVYDARVGSTLPDALRIDGAPLAVRALDDRTVEIRFPAPYSPGLRIVAEVPMLPAHLLSEALDAGALGASWDVTTTPDRLAGLGPFVLERYLPGERLRFARNPHYWRRDETGAPLPRLDALTLEIVPDQNAEFLRLAAGAIDFTQSEVRAEDYAAVRAAADAGRLELTDLGVGLDADFLFFNLRADALGDDPRAAWLQSDDFRRAVSHAVDRATFAETVYLGLGRPIHGPISPGNRRWHNPDAPRHPYDPAAAAARLAGLGLTDADGDGMLDDADGRPVRFTLLTHRGHTVRERAAAVLQEDLRQVGIAVDVVPLEFGALVERLTTMAFEAAYFGVRASDTDPAVNLDLWLSSAAFHFWNPSQPVPATAWEARIDRLMLEQMAAASGAERAALFDEVQVIFGNYLPAIYFAAPRMFIATSSRVRDARPALLEPYILWNADRLDVAVAR